jgi:hypothetical protein
VLQHGSFLLARSPAAPELPGLSEVARRDFAPEQVMGCWLETLSAQLRLRWIADELSQEERHRAARLVDGKHLAERWVIGRGRRAGQNSLDIGSRPG